MALTAEELVTKFKDKFKDNILNSEMRSWKEGVMTDFTQKAIWLTIHRDYLHRAVEFLKSIDYPHISIPMTFSIQEENMELVYMFTIFWGDEAKFKELIVTFKVLVPLNDLRVPTLTDLIPGVIMNERETQEMLGVEVENIPDGRRMFTPHNLDDIEKGMKPMRDDLGFGVEDFYKNREKGER